MSNPPQKPYRVFFEQVNRVMIEVKAMDAEDANEKAVRIYKRDHLEVPRRTVEEDDPENSCPICSHGSKPVVQHAFKLKDRPGMVVVPDAVAKRLAGFATDKRPKLSILDRRRLGVLKALDAGRVLELVGNGPSYRWADGHSRPSLANPVIAPLFANGYIIRCKLSSAGRTLMERLQKLA